jgi:hypothetical protein
MADELCYLVGSRFGLGEVSRRFLKLADDILARFFLLRGRERRVEHDGIDYA